MPTEKPCTAPDHVTPGNKVRLRNSHSLAGHGLFTVDKASSDGVVVRDAKGAKHTIKFEHIDCVMVED